MISVKSRVFKCLQACKSQNNNLTNLRKKNKLCIKKVNIYESLFFGGCLEIALLRVKTLTFSQVRKSPKNLIVMAYSLRVLFAYLLAIFPEFSCNIQSIAIIIAPAFKIQKHSFRSILKKRFPRPIVKLLVSFCHRVHY